MKKIYLLLTLCFAGITTAKAQDCSGNRYYQPIFSNVTVTSGIEYGSNFKQDGVTEEILAMDIYTPDGDTETERPLIIFAHGGSFIGGDRTQIAAQCEAYAKLGYVAVSISYRLLSIDATLLTNPGQAFKNEVVRAVHDMRAAIRYFRKDVAENNNTYKINPDLIIIGGVSAGAILANHAAYLDTDAKIPTDLVNYFNEQGGLEGNSGNAGYSSKPQMVVSLCGAIMDTTWMETGDQPYVGVHNITDNTVPNLSGQPNVGIAVPVTLQGDSLMYVRSLNQGIPSKYMSVNTTGHCDFPASAEGFVTDFMHEQICVQHLATKSNPTSVLFSVYPNPATSSFFVDVPSNSWDLTVTIIDVLGKEIYNANLPMLENRLEINTREFQTGIYLVKILSTDGKEATKRVVIN